MYFATNAVLAAGLASQVVATGWLNAHPYSSPDNCNNVCSDSQHSGYDWSGLSIGDFSSYGSNQFSGWKCADKLHRRDGGLLEKRTFGFQEKCVTADVQSKPKITCNDNHGMSIDHMHVSSEKDTKFECHYGMPDGNICKTYHTCGSSGTVIKNDQCGNATSVTFVPHKDNKDSCQFGVHSIGFNCVTSTTAKTTSTTPATTSTTPPVVTTTSSTSVATTTSSTLTTSTVPTTTSTPTTTTVPTTSSTSTPVVYSTPGTTTTPVTSTTGLVPTSVPTSSSTAVSPVTPTSSSTSTTSVPTTSATTPSTTPVAPTTTQSSTSSTSTTPAQQTPDCPGLLPRCLKTWMPSTSCKDNTDADCFCKDQKFVSSVMCCLDSWAGDDKEGQSAKSYFQGLCAAHIPVNPAIVTACSNSPPPPATSTPVSPVSSPPPAPSTITLYTTSQVTITSCGPEVKSCPASSTAVITTSSPISTSVVSPATQPTTVITYSSVLTLPCTEGGTTIPGSSTTTTVQTTLTVPQVYLTSSTVASGTAAPTVAAGLAAGTPSSAPATTTNAAGAVAASPTGKSPTTLASSGKQPPAPSASATGPVTFPGAASVNIANVGGLAAGLIAAIMML